MQKPIPVFAVVAVFCAGTITGAAVSAVEAQVTQAQAAAASDTEFIKKVAMQNVAEIAFGDIADDNAKRSEVKAYADMVEGEHVAAGRELKDLAEKKGVALPTDLNEAQKATRERLLKLKDEAFERAYLTQMVTDHKAAIAEFNKAAGSADADVKRFAERTLPSLRQHLTKAEELLKTVGK